MKEFMEKHISAYRRHKDYDPLLVQAVMEQDDDLVMAKATVESRKLYNKSRMVFRDFDKLRSFLRLEISRHGILYATIRTMHDIEDMIVRHDQVSRICDSDWIRERMLHRVKAVRRCNVHRNIAPECAREA